jgi:MFS superfamily sulfate permease-like transporter
MISTTAVDRLIQLGRRQGGLEIKDIRQALPIDTMTIEELADVVVRLEEAGISVEIDAALLTPRHQKNGSARSEAYARTLAGERAGDDR